jgi:catalase-peroxidase
MRVLMTDSQESFAVLKPKAEGFRDYAKMGYESAATELLVDKAQQLKLTAPQMTALVGGLRVLGVTAGGTSLGVFTQRVGTLTRTYLKIV